MPRPRSKDRDLPPRMHRKHGAFWHKQGNTWTRLAPLDDLVLAFSRYAQLEAGDDGDTLQHAINRFLERQVPTLKTTTQRDYRAACSALAAWAGHMRIDEIKPRDVARYLSECRPATVANKRIAVLSSICAAEVSAGRIDFNPCLGVRKNRQPRRDYVPTHEDLAALRAKIQPNIQVAMDLALATALRLSDLLALRRSDCLDVGLRATIGKTGGATVYEWTDQLREIVGRAGREWLVEGRNGRYTMSGFESTWQKAKRRAGFGHVRWHDLRARALTDAKRAGGRDYAQALAAHADGSTTERYIRERGEQRVRPLVVDCLQSDRLVK